MCVSCSKFVFVYQSVTAPLRDWRNVFIWALPRRSVCVFFSSVRGAAAWTKFGEAVNVLEVSSQLCLSACLWACESWPPRIRGLVGHVAYVSLTLWVTEKPSCLTITHHLHPLFPQTCKCTQLRKEVGVRWQGEGGGGVKKRGGDACRFMIIPKQMLLLRSLWIASVAARQKSRNQNTGLWGEVDERRRGASCGSRFPAFVSMPAFFLAPFFSGGGSPISLQVWVQSRAPFEVSVRDSGSDCRKKLISLCSIPSLTPFVSPTPEVICFIFL